VILPALLFALVLTNGPDAHVTDPLTTRVPWRFVADNVAWTACGPRLVCSVQHVTPPDPIFAGQTYSVILQILPPGSDVRFGVVDRDLPAYAPIYAPTNGWPPVDHIWLVAGGVGCGTVTGGTNFQWGAEGEWPVGSKRKRWGESRFCFFVPDLHYFVWEFTQAASASGDSGYGAFTDDGQYIGPIQQGENPCILGTRQSAGRLAGTYLEWIKDYLPTNSVPKPPKPRVIEGLKLKNLDIPAGAELCPTGPRPGVVVYSFPIIPGLYFTSVRAHP